MPRGPVCPWGSEARPCAGAARIEPRDHPPMAVSFLYLMARRVTGMLLASLRSAHAKDVEIAVLRQAPAATSLYRPVVGRVMLALTRTCFGAVGRVPRCTGSCSTVCAPTAAAATPGRRNEGASVGGHLGHGWVSGTRSGCSWAVWCWTWGTRRRRAEDH